MQNKVIPSLAIWPVTPRVPGEDNWGGVPDPRGTACFTGLEKGNQCQLLINLLHRWKSIGVPGYENIFVRAEPGKWRCRVRWEGSHVFISKQQKEMEGGVTLQDLSFHEHRKNNIFSIKITYFPQDLFTSETGLASSRHLNYGEISPRIYL